MKKIVLFFLALCAFASTTNAQQKTDASAYQNVADYLKKTNEWTPSESDGCKNYDVTFRDGTRILYFSDCTSGTKEVPMLFLQNERSFLLYKDGKVGIAGYKNDKPCDATPELADSVRTSIVRYLARK